MSSRAVFVAFLFGVFCASNIDAQNYTSVAYAYAPIAVPGATLTIANGINRDNVIVGSFFDASSAVHGFVYRNGHYEQVDFPGSSETEVLGINDRGDLVGEYQIEGPLNFHGFLRHEWEFTSIDAPEAEFGTRAFGVNNDMVIVGSFDDSQGFILERGSFSVFNGPQLPGEGFQTQLNGINNNRWISGQVYSGGAWRGFWVRNRDIDFLQSFGAPDNEVTGMNSRGDIVGCHDATSGFVSFEVELTKSENDKNETTPALEKLVSCVSGINYARVVVGNYFQVNRPNAFVGVPQLTLHVHTGSNALIVKGPLRISAAASGIYPIREIQVWVNFREVLRVKGASLKEQVTLPKGVNERIVVQAIDAQGVKTKVMLRRTVQ